jgi:putative N6-adenine-specific DNA methylase
MFLYQKSNRYFGQIDDGLEEIGCRELASFGATEPYPVYRGMYFKADHNVLYKTVYCTRLFTRILAPLLRFDCHSSKYLYKTAGNIDWSEIFTVEDTFAIDATVSHSKIKHSQYAALCLKDAVVDQFRNISGSRPTVDTRNPAVRLNLHIANNKAVIALDLGGGSLHRRGYRQRTISAPMRETTAAAIISMIDWAGSTPLVDFMCGSGTLVTEAFMHYCRIPAGYLRQRFGLAFLPDFDRDLWRQVREEADRRIRPLPPHLIRASDSSREAITAAASNWRRLPYGENISFRQCRFQDIPGLEKVVIVSNPPYGQRLLTGGDIKAFVRELGDFLKQRCKGSTAYLYFGRRDLIKNIGLRAAWKKPLKNGGLDGRLVKYELY